MALPAPTSAGPAGAPISVVIAEDDPVSRAALSALVEAERALELVGVAADAVEAITLVASEQPQVCIVDVHMPAGGGAHAARAIRERCPATQVLALSGREDRATVVEMLRAGAAGYLVKGNDAGELVQAVHAAARGQRTVSRQVADGVVGELADQLAREDAERLRRDRQRERIQRVVFDGQLSMAFQPIVELASRRVVGFESLARFASEPVRSPDLWFAEAAEVDRLAELELAAVRAALRGLPQLPVDAFLTINVSPGTAASDALLMLLSPVVGRRVIVEITEHAPIADYDAFAPRLERLRRREVRVAIDDAGAGFASLRHILRLAPDLIKLDMALTRQIATDRAERALTRALISFAGETDAVIVAEGIESEAEISALRELGVRYGQGFHLGRPARLEPGDSAAARSQRPVAASG